MSEQRKPAAEVEQAAASEGSPLAPRAPEKARDGMSRREFARRAAIASAISPTITAAMVAWTPITAAGAAANPPSPVATTLQSPAAASAAPTTTSSATGAQAPILPKLSVESQAEVDARVQGILGQYDSRFSEEQKSDIRRLCTLAQPPLDRMRAYHLDNADGPALYLKPLVEREKKPAAPVASKPSARKP
jgi:hypothetical protein